MYSALLVSSYRNVQLQSSGNFSSFIVVILQILTFTQLVLMLM